VADADLAFAGLARQAELVRRGEVSSRELIELCLARIGRVEPELNAFRVVMGERALAEADQADARRAAGESGRPLLGVPVAVKDNLDVAGETTEHGTAAGGGPAASDSELVRRLRAAGAVLVGKTRLSELAMWPFTLSGAWGVTRNPWDTDRTTGGSSGGAAAAVAAGLAGAATASDGGGSIRIPAASCGLFGLKPQRGRVSLGPDPEHWSGLSVAGAVTRTVMDTAVYLDAVSGPAPGDAHTAAAPSRPFAESAAAPPGRLRIALSLGSPSPPTYVAEEVKRGVRDTADVLRSLGHEVVEHKPDFGLLLPLFLPRWLRGIKDDADRMKRPDRLERRSRNMARLGSLVPEGAVAKSRQNEAALNARLAPTFRDHDVLLTVMIPTLPLELDRLVGRSTGRTFAEAANFAAFSLPWNLTGQPSAAVPAGYTAEGVPLSAQLVGRPEDEGTLLSLAAQIEAERPWAGRRPPVG
jgi:amidase